MDDSVQARQEIQVVATKTDGTVIEFATDCRIDTPVEVDYYRNGGILHTVLLDYVQKNKLINKFTLIQSNLLPKGV